MHVPLRRIHRRKRGDPIAAKARGVHRQGRPAITARRCKRNPHGALLAWTPSPRRTPPHRMPPRYRLQDLARWSNGPTVSRCADCLRNGVHLGTGIWPLSRLAPASQPSNAAAGPMGVEQSGSPRNIVAFRRGIGTGVIYGRSLGPPPRTTFSEELTAYDCFRRGIALKSDQAT